MSRDINDRLKDGDLPEDVKDLCDPVNELAKKFDDKNPRIRTVEQLLRASHKRAINKEKRRSLTTCSHKLDAKTGGIRPGHIWVIGADTSWGKSSWLIAVADENMNEGARVLIVSAEDDESIYADRLLARRSRVLASHIRDRCLTNDELAKVTDTVSKAKPDPVFLDARGMPVERLCVQIGNAIEKHKIDLVCIDYLQEIKTDQRFQDERVKFREIASMLRGVIKSRRVAGIIASQITVVDGKKTPDKHSIRESRDVSNAAEVVALGFTSDVRIEKEKKDKDGNVRQDVIADIGQKVIKIDKCKDGEKCTVGMQWDEKSACFDRTIDEAEEYRRFVGFEPDNERSYGPIFGIND